jgi:hypothetical protein
MEYLISDFILLETERGETCKKIDETKLKISEKLNDIDLIKNKKLELNQNIIKLVLLVILMI